MNNNRNEDTPLVKNRWFWFTLVAVVSLVFSFEDPKQTNFNFDQGWQNFEQHVSLSLADGQFKLKDSLSGFSGLFNSDKDSHLDKSIDEFFSWVFDSDDDSQSESESSTQQVKTDPKQVALHLAQQYEDGPSPLSKKKLYEQLVSKHGEHLHPSLAKYAVAHVKVDYNKAALKSAKNYVNIYLSKKRVAHMLVSKYGEQYTQAQADYAMKHLKADWKKNALEKAKEYRKYSHMSKAEIRRQLTSEYGGAFTKEEVEYALKHLK